MTLPFGGLYKTEQNYECHTCLYKANAANLFIGVVCVVVVVEVVVIGIVGVIVISLLGSTGLYWSYLEGSPCKTEG